VLRSKVVDHIVEWLGKRLVMSHRKGFVGGVSGGIDSAVTSTLAAMTGEPVEVLSMPINQASDQAYRATDHINWLHKKFENVTSQTIDLTNVLEAYTKSLPDDISELAMANTRSRIRMATLYAIANHKQALVLGTGNKVEDHGVGFFTKYGDGGVDLSPIGGLTKTQVYDVAKYLEIIDSIQVAKPTDGLWGDNRSDEDQLGATYSQLEAAMEFCDMFEIHTVDQYELVKDQIFPKKTSPEVIRIYLERHEASAHKMEMPPICEIPEGFLKQDVLKSA